VILVTSAVAEELSFWTPRADVTVLVTGIGPVEASAATATELARSPYDLVINAGIAGTFDGAAKIGDGVVIAEDSMELNLESGAQLVLPRGTSIVDSARSDAPLVSKLVKRGFAALHGITVSHVTCSEATALRLSGRGAQVESMEGFAVLRAAERAGVRAVEVRGISNRCGDRESSGWSFAAGVSGLERVLDALLEVYVDGGARRS
jgi:futalosine hydrolase